MNTPDEVHPVDEERTPPPQKGVDVDTLTADIESALRVAVHARIARIAEQRGIGLRAAAIVVLKQLRIP